MSIIRYLFTTKIDLRKGKGTLLRSGQAASGAFNDIIVSNQRYEITSQTQLLMTRNFYFWPEMKSSLQTGASLGIEIHGFKIMEEKQ